MKYIDNDVLYNNVLSGNVSIGIGGPLTAKTKYQVDENGNIIHRNSDYLVNAIDIHWGDVTIGEKTIISTSDLLKWVLSIKEEVQRDRKELNKLIEIFNETYSCLNKDGQKSYLKLKNDFRLEEGNVARYIDVDGNIIDNFLPIYQEDLQAFNIHNMAPYNAIAIGIYENESSTTPKGYVLLGNLKKEFGTRLYRVGLCSDIHYNDNDSDPNISNDDGTEYYGDTINFLKFYSNKNNVNFIATSGDISTDSMHHCMNFMYLLRTHCPNLNFYSCYGNHDYAAANYNPTQIINDDGFGFGDMTRIQYWNKLMVGEKTEYEIHHYDDDIQSKGYASYWFEVPIVNGKSDIYIFLSVDYGVTNETQFAGMSRAQLELDYNDENVIQIANYLNESLENRNEDRKQYDYQIYDSGVLIWFKNLLERFNNKRIFVFTHKFFIHKAGNNNSGWGMNYSEDDWRVSRFDQNHSSYCLCGLQFEFLNKLNNTYKNTIWFTGHSHYSWLWQQRDPDINITNKEYEYVDPQDEEYRTNPEKRYLRKYHFNDEQTISETGYNVHIPSTCRPIRKDALSYDIAGETSEGALMDVYEDYVDIRGVCFKNKNSEASYTPISPEYVFVDIYKSNYDPNQSVTQNEEYNTIVTFTNNTQRFYIDFQAIKNSLTNYCQISDLKIIDGNGGDVTEELLGYENPKIGIFGDDHIYHLRSCNANKTYDGNYNKTGLEIACSSSFNVTTISHIDFPITLYMNISIRNLEYREENYINKYFPISQYRIPIKAN